MAGKLFAKHVVRKIFLEDWGLKVIALVITLGLWFGVTGLSTPTNKRFTVALAPSISNNAEITNTLPPEVDIVLSGDKRKLEQLNKNDLTATLDLTDVPPGDRVVSLTPENVYVNLPPGIKLSEIQPGRIAVNLEAVEEKELEVRSETKGSPAAGFEVYASVVSPPRVKVRGPASVIRTLDSVETAKIDLAGKKSDFTAQQIALNVANPKATVFNTVVDVFFRIGERRVERAFTIPVTGLDGKTASFIIYAPRTLLSQIKSDDVKVEMILNDKGEEVPQVTLPTELRDIAEVRRLKLNP
ncbi:MAG: CdaR family protein [Pyrinomonadaceae bacterium]